MTTTITAPDSGACAAPEISAEHLRFVPAPVYEPVGEPSRSTDTAVVTLPAGVPRVRRKPPVTVPAATLEARRVAIRTVTALFEVLDRRRALAHLETLVSPKLYQHVETLLRPDLVRPDGRGPGETAHVRRVHIQMRDSTTAEIFGSYERGRRVRAFAGRIERVPVRVRQASRSHQSIPVRVEYRWRLASLDLG
ncbi:Rv3235 family protein [Gordonia sp. DT30]|uniref:Rv3235 family protein n=1 Tax=unclassified Gordonia (in: high G+C Gram-positive bacteria) TaxID=2657482 RepID=UPI003CFB3D7C